MTARDVLDLIKKNLGSPWNENTYRDVFHAGDPNVEVKGIATTFMATLGFCGRSAGLRIRKIRGSIRSQLPLSESWRLIFSGEPVRRHFAWWATQRPR